MDGRNKDLYRFQISGHQECFYPIANHIFIRNNKFDTRAKSIQKCSKTGSGEGVNRRFLNIDCVPKSLIYTTFDLA